MATLKELKLSTFSATTDYTLKETQVKLRDVINNIGLCYYEMNEEDISLYRNIYPTAMSFFAKTLNNESFVNKLPQLRKYQKQCINYGYVDRQNLFDQSRAFITPFEEFKRGTLFINDSTNPFKANKSIAKYAQNMNKHCQFFFGQLLRSYLNENGIKYESINNEVLKLMGNNRCKHLRFNYYNPLVPQKNKKILFGVRPHSDYGFLTFLKPSSPGLQVQHKKEWRNVPFFENKFVINFGKALQITTDYGIKAVPHRVPLIGNEPRFSIAFFYDPDIGGDLCQYQLNGKLKVLKDFKSYFYGDMFTKHGKIAKNAYKSKL